MNTLVNNYDAIEKLIYEEGLRIEAIDFHPELDVLYCISVYLLIKSFITLKKIPWPNMN